MEFDLVQRRKIIREYLPTSRFRINSSKLIDNADRASSASHTQVQESVIIKDFLTKKKLRKAAVDEVYV